MVDRIVGDIRVSFRTFFKTPAFTLAVVATAALAIGATTATFAVVDHILLRPLAFPDSERVVALCETSPATEGWCGASPPNVADWARMTPALESGGVARTESFIVKLGGRDEGVQGGIVSPGFFEVLRIQPLLGRLIEARDLPRGTNHVAVVSHTFWQQLGGDPAVVGRAVTIDNASFVIVGVLPANIYMPDIFGEVEVWKPLTASVDNVENRGWRGFTALGRLAGGVDEAKLFAELSVVRSQLEAAYPEANRGWGLRIVGLREHIVGDTRRTLWIFLGTAAVVLLIACANIAGLLLVRATGRAGEFAIRASLGAGRRRLVQQLITESLILSLLGAACGLLLASWAVEAFVSLAPATIPRLEEVKIDGRVVAFTVTLAIVTALVFGLAPALRARKTDLNGALKGVRGGHASDTRMRSTFAVLQLSLALVLLFGAGLLTQSLARFMLWDPGFDRTHVVTSWMLPPRTPGGVLPVMLRVREEIQSVPGVERVGLGSAGPLFGGEETGTISIAGRADLAASDPSTVLWFDIDEHYFEALGVSLVRGRAFSAGDTASAPAVAIVNETLVRRFFPGGDPLGRRVTVENHPADIVGVVRDIKPLRPDEPTRPHIYWPIQQYPRGAAYIVMRTRPELAGVEEAIRARVAAIGPGIQLSTFTRLNERVERRLVSPRFNMTLVSALAAVALIIAAIGVYGVNAHAVASRMREFGIRLALGASPADLMATVFRRGMMFAAAGVALGSVGAFVLAELLSSLLYGVPPRDPMTLAAAATFMTAVAALACWLPARRAGRVDPVEALRAD
jgi:putative ABC transport system permease protein